MKKCRLQQSTLHFFRQKVRGDFDGEKDLCKLIFHFRLMKNFLCEDCQKPSKPKELTEVKGNPLCKTLCIMFITFAKNLNYYDYC